MFLINRFIIGSRHGSLCVYFSQDFLPCPCSWHSLAYFTFYFFSRSLIVLISLELHSLWSQSTGTIFRQSLIGGCLEKGTAETHWKEHKHLFSFSALGRGRGSFPQPNPSCSALQHQLPSAAQEDLERILRWDTSKRGPETAIHAAWWCTQLDSFLEWLSRTSCNLFQIISHMCRKRTELLPAAWAWIRC